MALFRFRALSIVLRVLLYHLLLTNPDSAEGTAPLTSYGHGGLCEGVGAVASGSPLATRHTSPVVNTAWVWCGGGGGVADGGHPVDYGGVADAAGEG